MFALHLICVRRSAQAVERELFNVQKAFVDERNVGKRELQALKRSAENLQVSTVQCNCLSGLE